MMKLYLIRSTLLVLLVIASKYGSGQQPLNSQPSQDKNYVLVNTYTDVFSSVPSNPTIGDLIQKITYYDGLGRVFQELLVKGGDDFEDIITPRAYDQFGREVKNYLPYATAAGAVGSFRSSAIAAQATFYNSAPTGIVTIPSVNGLTPSYSQTLYERSPLNRPLEQGAPGAPWQVDSSAIPGSGHTVKSTYLLNNDVAITNLEETRRVVRYDVNLTGTYQPSLVRNGYYPADRLLVKVTKDENWTPSDGRAGTVEEYTGSDGRIILKRAFNRKGGTLEMLSTYYVYDPYGNLTYVLPPAAGPDASSAPNATTLNNYCYQYKYDGRNRLVEKKLPGKGWEYLVYNELDQVVATQDALQRARKEWTVTKYDWQKRVVLTALWNNNNTTISRVNLQTLVDAESDLWEDRIATGTGYTNQAWPTQYMTTTLTLHYYDDYDIPGLPAGYDYTGGSTMTLGLATASRTKVLNAGTGTSNMLWEVWYYDDKGQITRQYKQHYKGGGTASVNNYDLVTTSYTFTGQPVEIIRRHYTAGTLALTLRTRHTYDHAGRLKDTWKQVNTDDSVLFSRNHYNATGQLTEKELHKQTGGVFAQEVEYRYNPRGWLKTSEAGLFKLELMYEDGATAQYNGNISAQTFIRKNTSDINETLTYSYTYDQLNRLLSGTLGGGKGKEELTYDKMGNIQTLERTGISSTVVDNLTYDYSANRLTKVTDAAGETTGNYQLAGLTTYTYDANGNIKTRKNTAHTGNNITAITYNHLNLPRSLTTASGTITYVYDATGRKLRSTNGVPGQTRDYIDGIEYTGGTLELIHTEEGRIVKLVGAGFEYQYVLRDHLGNSRVGFAESTTEATTPNFTADYYPFGLQYLAGKRQPSIANHYLYNGKEVQDGLKWVDYGARFYDPVIGRWGVVDAMAENYQSWSQYNYGLNNPTTNIDPDGRSVSSSSRPGDIQRLLGWAKMIATDEECSDPPCNESSKIAIDPGHGIQGNNNSAMDPGAVANGFKESNLTLLISDAVNSYLKSFGEGTIMIRESEIVVDGNSLIYRTDKAKAANSDIFVSIHINSAANESASGFTVLYKAGGSHSDQNKTLAQSIADNQTIMSIRGNGITARSDLSVLNRFSSSGPAVLVETGFITNKSDAALMSTRAASIGKDIALGIYKFLTGGSPPNLPPVSSYLQGQ